MVPLVPLSTDQKWVNPFFTRPSLESIQTKISRLGIQIIQILGNVCLAAALFFELGMIANFTVGNFGIGCASAIVCLALFILGDNLRVKGTAEKPLFSPHISLFTKSSSGVQNRPIGIKNSGENICWANAALQAIFLKKDTELYRFLKEQTPDNLSLLSGFIHCFEKDRASGKSVTEADSTIFRSILSANQGRIGRFVMYQQDCEDVTEQLNRILKLIPEKTSVYSNLEERTYYQVQGEAIPHDDMGEPLKQVKGHPHLRVRSVSQRALPQIQILPQEGVSWAQLLQRSLQDDERGSDMKGQLMTPSGERMFPIHYKMRVFTESPKNLIINFIRGIFPHQNPGGVQSQRDLRNVPVHVPLDFYLPAAYVNASEDAHYIVDGVIVYLLNHFVAYTLIENRWYRCDDTIVREASEEEVQNAAKVAYALHLAKV